MPALVGASNVSTPARACTLGRITASARRPRTRACRTRASASERSKLDAITASMTSSSTGSVNARHHSRAS